MQSFVHELRNQLAQTLSKGIVSGATILCLGILATIAAAGSVPAWTLALTACATAACCAAVLHGRSMSARFEERYLHHLGQILARSTRSIATTPEARLTHVTREVLGPAKDLLAADTGDDVRLAVLVGSGDDFVMAALAGFDESIGRVFSLPIARSIARVAYDGAQTVTWSDVLRDSRWLANPKARRQTRAFVAVPLDSRKGIFGVLTVASDRVAGFGPAEILYIQCIGELIASNLGHDHAPLPALPEAPPPDRDAASPAPVYATQRAYGELFRGEITPRQYAEAIADAVRDRHSLRARWAAVRESSAS